MHKLQTKLGLMVLVLGVSLSSWAANPCMPIAEACMKEGYYKGGNKEGKGLVENCVMPVVSGGKTLPNTAFTDTMKQECKMMIMAKMKENSANNQ